MSSTTTSIVTEVGLRRPDNDRVQEIGPPDEVLASTLTRREYLEARARATGGEVVQRMRAVTTTVSTWAVVGQ